MPMHHADKVILEVIMENYTFSDFISAMIEICMENTNSFLAMEKSDIPVEIDTSSLLPEG